MNKQEFNDDGASVQRPDPASMKMKYTLRQKFFHEPGSVEKMGYNDSTGLKDWSRYGNSKSVISENMNFQPLGDLMFNFKNVPTATKIKETIKLYDAKDVESEIMKEKPKVTNGGNMKQDYDPTPEKQLMNENYEKNAEVNITAKPNMTGMPF